MDERSATPAYRKQLTDQELGSLVEQVCCGDAEAFERLVRRMQGPLRSFCRRMIGDAYLGDDAAQETFVRIWKGLRRGDRVQRFLPWAFAIARNTCIELLRREERRPTPVDPLGLLEAIPEGQRSLTAAADPEAAELRTAVAEAIEGLAEPYRSTFLLRHTGFSYEEIAGITSCPIGTVRSRLFEARRLLSHRLAPLVFGEDVALLRSDGGTK
ncbi:MAG: RNA polymerase sigma factor [Acidimicrobiia bacterium]